jgi:hypothetical protein
LVPSPQMVDGSIRRVGGVELTLEIGGARLRDITFPQLSHNYAATGGAKREGDSDGDRHALEAEDRA